jgi:hypothetical protein
VRDSTILARKDGALNFRCTLRKQFCASYISSFKTIFSILCYVEFWKDMVQYACIETPSLLSNGYQELFPWG